MQNRSGYIVAALIGGMLVLLLGLAGLGVWTIVGQLDTREEVASTLATMQADGIEIGVPDETTPTSEAIQPTLVPTPSEADTPELPMDAATPMSEAISTTTPTEGAANEPATPTDEVSNEPGTTNAAVEPPPPLPTGDADWSAALQPTSREKLAAHPDAPVYTIGARFDPERNTITGAQTLVVTNAEDTPLNELYLRMYPNATFYRDGGIEVSNVRVDGAEAQTALEVDDTALKITLPQPLAVGARAELALDFVTTVPDFGAGYGIFGVANGVYSLYNWHPELAVYEDGAWLLNPVTEQGDPTNTDIANYQVVLTTPDDVRAITSGVESEPRAAAGEVEYTVTSALTRNFVMVLSDRLEEATQQVGDVTVNSYYLQGDEEGGDAALQTAARSVEIFSEAFGAYTYPELDVAEVKLGGGAAGMESTGLILIGSDLYAPEQADMLAGLETLVPGAADVTTIDFVTAHETAHQWWYGAVGSDAYEQPWLDEALTNWSSAYYVDEAIGPEAGLLARDIFIGFPYRNVLTSGDQRLDAPVDTFSSDEYSAIVYGKGALMYDVLREEIGEERFWAFLRDYYTTYQFERADGTAWQETLAKHTDAATAQAFVDKWVEGSNIRADDLPPGGPMQGILSGDLSGIDIDKLIPTPGGE